MPNNRGHDVHRATLDAFDVEAIPTQKGLRRSYGIALNAQPRLRQTLLRLPSDDFPRPFVTNDGRNWTLLLIQEIDRLSVANDGNQAIRCPEIKPHYAHSSS